MYALHSARQARRYASLGQWHRHVEERPLEAAPVSNGSTFPAPPPAIPKQDKRTLPPDMRQEIVDLHAQYPAFRPHELATICFLKFNRKPAPATIKLILASGPKPSTTERCFPRYADIEDGAERRRAIIRLHADGWNAKSIAGYLEVSRQTVHTTLKRWAKEQFAGIEEKSHAQASAKWISKQCKRSKSWPKHPADWSVSRECCPRTDGDETLARDLWASAGASS